MLLFLDDLRNPPDGFTVCRTYEDCIKMLQKNQVEVISLDHDLGTEKTGYSICLWMVENNYIVPKIYIHSANPVGMKNMVQILDRYMPIETEIYTKIGKDFIQVYRNGGN